VIHPGNSLRTSTPGLTIYARANVAETFEKKVAIYNLKKFLGVISLFKEAPEISFSDTHCTLEAGRQKINYVLGEEALIKTASETDPKVPEPLLTFQVSKDDLNSAVKAVSVLNLPDIEFYGKGGKIGIGAVDVKNSSKDLFSLDVGETKEEFSVRVPRDSFKFLEAENYEVSVHPNYIKVVSGDVTYWIGPSV
jgi:DNA polymerase III sliding clamp (beta) subunit (PCNA family)